LPIITFSTLPITRLASWITTSIIWGELLIGVMGIIPVFWLKG
jgi:hypothetical protein